MRGSLPIKCSVREILEQWWKVTVALWSDGGDFFLMLGSSVRWGLLGGESFPDFGKSHSALRVLYVCYNISLGEWIYSRIITCLSRRVEVESVTT